jgi:hypothetical protein
LEIYLNQSLPTDSAKEPNIESHAVGVVEPLEKLHVDPGVGISAALVGVVDPVEIMRARRAVFIGSGKDRGGKSGWECEKTGGNEKTCGNHAWMMNGYPNIALV